MTPPPAPAPPTDPLILATMLGKSLTERTLIVRITNGKPDRATETATN